MGRGGEGRLTVHLRLTTIPAQEVPVRLLIAVGFVIVSSVPSGAATPDRAWTFHVTNLTSWRPQAWQPPPALPGGAGIRIEPEQGTDMPNAAEPGPQADARRQALARVPVGTRPDGSRYAVIGGLVRAYTVATVKPDGHLVEECVHSEQQARQRMSAASGAKEK